MDVYRQNQRYEPLRASMAVPDPEMLRAIHQISEALGSYERSKILYLCEISDTGNTAAHIKETLKSKVKSDDKGRLFLAELMLHLGRYDILRQVFGFSRDDVERALRSEQVLPRFRVLMAHISEDMAKDDVSSVKFLLAHMLPRKKIETAKDFLDLVIELEHVGKVSPTRVDLLEECLMDIGRVDLAKKLKVYKMSASRSWTQVFVSVDIVDERHSTFCGSVLHGDLALWTIPRRRYHAAWLQPPSCRCVAELS
ncbi:CASP8 and FADD-like apoptosis regulator isoform X2 [Syngnathoides biaculeatus]|uniref:CASP8 and FADD-like apoptosis regulator isoform X2 n=1 Tax=Syngnathoides biaculeatus TaxID=300417 RepID=UPI002ADD548A|nr:CASP8 and FADD-like apoptosis regulator isoform X2 [Syngnathoides biaculeatus]